MKRFAMMVVAAIALSGPLAMHNAHAQIEMTLGGGVNAPTGNFADEVNTGYAFTAGVGYRVVPLALLGVEATYNGNGLSDEQMDALGPEYDASSSIFQYALIGKFILPVGEHSVFAKGSVGNYRGSASVSGPLGEASITETDLGYGLGGGFVVNGNESAAFYADLTYHNVRFDGGDADTNFLTITAGALIRFDLSRKSIRDDLQDDLDKLRD